MPLLLNNVHGRRHAEEYNDISAFFDIGSTGFQAERYGGTLDALRPGDLCIVASTDHDNLYRFTQWSFTHQKILNDRQARRQRVLFGQRLGAQTLLKSEAAERPEYARFFTRQGAFRRPSVIVT